MELKQKHKDADLEIMRKTLLNQINKRYKPRFFSQVGYWVQEIMAFIFIVILIPFVFLYSIIELIFGRHK